MSFTLLHSGGANLLGTDSPVIKASEAIALADSVSLLEEAGKVLAEARKERSTLRDEARGEGLAEGVEAVRGEVAARLKALATELAESQRKRDEELAEAAMAAVKAILGDSAPEVIGPALVGNALASFTDGQPVELEVAPALAGSVRGELDGDPRVRIIENPDLGPLDCELRLASGAISAGLDVQLAALAERWGLSPEQKR